jgi:hypothetical protein
VDRSQPEPVSTDVDELRPQGGTPIAASLRDMRTAIYNSARLDTRTPCRKHQVIFLTDGGESCETVADAVTAAGTFQNMSFTNAAGTVVPDYDVPVYVIGFAVCPPGQPNCQTRQDLNSIAAAGGTGTAILVNSQLELQLALAQIVASSVLAERCNNLDDDCDGAIDEDFPGKRRHVLGRRRRVLRQRHGAVHRRPDSASRATPPPAPRAPRCATASTTTATA